MNHNNYQPATYQLTNDRLQRYKDSTYQHGEAGESSPTEKRGLFLISAEEKFSWANLTNHFLRLGKAKPKYSLS